MLPLMQAISDGEDHIMRDLTEQLAERFGLTDEER
jgi:hypothetical protein